MEMQNESVLQDDNDVIQQCKHACHCQTLCKEVQNQLGNKIGKRIHVDFLNYQMNKSNKLSQPLQLKKPAKQEDQKIENFKCRFNEILDSK